MRAGKTRHSATPARLAIEVGGDYFTLSGGRLIRVHHLGPAVTVYIGDESWSGSRKTPAQYRWISLDPRRLQCHDVAIGSFEDHSGWLAAASDHGYRPRLHARSGRARGAGSSCALQRSARTRAPSAAPNSAIAPCV